MDWQLSCTRFQVPFMGYFGSMLGSSEEPAEISSPGDSALQLNSKAPPECSASATCHLLLQQAQPALVLTFLSSEHRLRHSGNTDSSPDSRGNTLHAEDSLGCYSWGAGPPQPVLDSCTRRLRTVDRCTSGLRGCNQPAP